MDTVFSCCRRYVARNWGGGVISVAFLILQAFSADYGTKINNLPHVVSYEINESIASDSALSRKTVAGETLTRESIDRWMTRYKLFSIDADEMINVMALARLRQDWKSFDLGVYQYGGAWLYPLGAWYFTLSKFGYIEVASLETLLRQPEFMDAVYYSGRLFVAVVVAISGFVMFRTLRLLSSTSVALAGQTIFLTAPTTIMYSQLSKPHWYALIWVTLAVYFLTRVIMEKRWSRATEVFVGVCVGLTFASVNTYAPFTVFVWCALVLMVRNGLLPFRVLFSIPAIAVVAWCVTNFHVLLHWEEFRHAAGRVSEWFDPELTLQAGGSFLWNSGLRGFGFAFSGAALAVALLSIIRPKRQGEFWLSICLLVTVVFVSWITSSMMSWGINGRYIPYFLVGGLLLLATVEWKHWGKVMGAIAALTMVQSIPLTLAYFDEDHPQYSTRMAMAEWIHETVVEDTALCVGTGTPAPYEVPPIDFTRYRINDADCKLMVRIERQQAELGSPEGWSAVKRFEPRLYSNRYRLVFGHINPQATLYEREDAN